MLLQNMKIGTRLTAGFGVIGLLALAMGMLAFNKISDIGIGWGEYENVHAVKQDSAEYLLKRWESNITRIKKFIEKGGDYSERFLSEVNGLDKTIATYREKGMLSPEEKELIASILSNQEIYRDIMKTVAEMKKKGADVTAMHKAAVGPEEPLFQAIKNLVAINKEQTKAKSKEIKTLVESGKSWIVSGLILITIVALAIILFITISITHPLGKAIKIAKQVAAGDLTGHIEVTSRDETGELLQALKTMNDGILCIAKEVRASSNTITVAVKEIAVGNSDLSQRTEEQASSLEETASSMEELISTVKQNAENSKQANSLASSASSVAIKGGDIVGKVVVTMDLISGSSKKIVDIISVIEGIAFQTNILSLNAAVEAARAGEQGRGFAVVASEVRNLAQRSAAAAKEIKALIGDSVGKVSDGTKLVEEAGRTMDEIVTSVKKVNDIIAEIAAASEEQISGIEQVNQAIVQMDEVTQQNAALVEEAAASAAALEEQATNLNMAIGLFKLGGVGQTQPVSLHSNRAEAEPIANKRKLSTTRKPSSPAAMTAPVRPVKVAKVNGDWREF